MPPRTRLSPPDGCSTSRYEENVTFLVQQPESTAHLRPACQDLGSCCAGVRVS